MGCEDPRKSTALPPCCNRPAVQKNKNDTWIWWRRSEDTALLYQDNDRVIEWEKELFMGMGSIVVLSLVRLEMSNFNVRP
jgi:hypothetical protein